jgi:predicted Rossmann fold flavoprotein
VADPLDILVIGCGAAGLFASTWAGRVARRSESRLAIVGVDGARKLGAKILVAGGGRCNVTHRTVSEADYAGSTPAAIRKILRRFTAADAINFFEEAGVKLKTEDSGKLFPVSDSARTVLAALLREAAGAGCQLVHPARVTGLERTTEGFTITADVCTFRSRRVILCTGGKSLPKSGSDGLGFDLARRLGHTLTAPIVPALVPLVLEPDHWIPSLAGLTLPTEVTLRTPAGKRLLATSGSTLLTHVGLSGPAVLDISRHWLVARAGGESVLTLNWLPGETAESVDRLLLAAQGRGVLAALRARLPDRLARILCEQAGAAAGGDLSRESRRRLVAAVIATPLPIIGDRGFTVAEATAGGVPLVEVRLETMESRICPGLFLAGEVLDVDGRIGGFNFQWAWASGFVAGSAAAKAAVQSRDAIGSATGSPAAGDEAIS